ncbi:hypothetical protein ACFYRW_22265 [Rhodococcus pyridinivorans]|uniref:hypothetical protein n=1 Tax=Rhodococcus pyridinivorans TaxID=103816 RepID=UPI001E406243|nr:hypothetical protein [Rhodococcus pyridinivorans]MCD5422755.1 hypothetical protein [Rhodococcus pyridinivorans]
MAIYATAVQTRAQHHPTFDSDHVPGFPVPGGAHAVEWPDPQGRGWDDMETLCGLPTRGMEQHEHSDPTRWPQGMIARWACSACQARVDQ